MTAELTEPGSPVPIVKNRKPQLKALTGLRFLAAMQVLILHNGFYFTNNLVRPAQPFLAAAPVWVQNIAACGGIGVSLFFVLSGFILSYNYFDDLTEGRIDRKAFWIARLARVYPVYLVSLLFAFPLFVRETVLLGNPNGAIGTVLGVGTTAAVTLLQSWLPQTASLLNPPGWSLSVEAFFYLMFPFVVPLFLRLSFKRLMLVGLALWFLSIAVSLLYILLDPDGTGSGSAATMAFWLDLLKFNPLARFPEFVIGMVVGRAFLLRRDGGNPAGGLLSACAAVGILAVFGVSSMLPFALLHNSLLAPLFAMLIYGLAQSRGLIASFLSLPALVLLGEASYALYLTHLPLSRYGNWLAKKFGIDGFTSFPFFIIYTIAAILLSIVILKFVEDPSRRAIRKWLAGT
ncbi:MAG TPA: acyltransferase [Bacteroidetes bacterium]|jgi:peptidoglycan/LPS O-acetylase OafA/YrhL|nr:acyltransferase [Bacteroidota bacterium]